MKLSELKPRTVSLGIANHPETNLPPSKTQGELMSYRKGYTAGLAEGRRAGMELAAKICERVEFEKSNDHAKAIREAIPKRQGSSRGRKAW